MSMTNPNLERFTNPNDTLTTQDNVGVREVAITHPDNNAHIRIMDNGDIQIISDDGIGIILSRARRTIILHADQVKIHTKEDGMRWNGLNFNHKAVSFNEPAFLKVIDTDAQHIYKGANAFFNTTTPDPTLPTPLQP